MVALLEDIHFVALSAQLTEPSGPSPNDSLCVARSVPEEESPCVCTGTSFTCSGTQAKARSAD